MVEHGVHAWDVAATKAIVEEAGGRFTDFEGRATAFGGTAIASNGLVHEEIRQLINKG
jgi:histidinol-phosphatase